MSYQPQGAQTPVSTREAVEIGTQVAARLKGRGALIGSWIAAFAAITSAVVSGYMLQQISDGNNETTRELADLERTITEMSASAARFQTAAEHLGSEAPMTRLAGLHALSALAADRPEYAERSAQVTAAFIKLHADREGQPNPGVRPLEVDTAHSTLLRLSKLGREHGRHNGNETFAYDLAHQSVKGKDWSDLYAWGAYFFQTSFLSTDLSGATLICTTAIRASFLDNTDLTGARFEFVDITGADFSGARGLDTAQWNGVYWNQSDQAPKFPQGMSLAAEPISAAEREAACPT
jgi:hypothetical protein